MNKISFIVGQEWSYKTRENEKESTYIITKIDDKNNKQNIIHIYIKNLKMKNALSQTGFNDHIVHLPFDYNSLKECTLDLKTQHQTLPDFKEGYLEWIKMFESGKAGVFKIPLSDAINYLEHHFN
ncbi:MAG: hypothetical protein COA79_06260 [Planctomycetota bacterium]|nr:MAG: hypothetical protein COA79_06260 [Planctomycetota bacterium]